jgi:hypothetical protein
MLIIDKVFGKMEYKHSWRKKDCFLFLDKAYIVNIIAQAYQGDDILEIQRNNYMNYKREIEINETEIKKKLVEYCQFTYNIDILLEECRLKPKTIIFERDGSWGILFDIDYDIENGIALFFIDRQIQIGHQDLFL